MGKCVKCGAETARSCQKCMKCMKCSKKAVQAMFHESPELKQAFQETLAELQRPENIQKMTAQITPVIQAVAALRKSKE